ncbi:unnamed protein product [Staurois parvus]|uniref:C2 domain-containing protein n=1 Tax=Staurois parvus TaxID=386267 RepID=A0ABN9G7N9_9NEOB|nr:unnamed protein product [Staurois parvus]
MVDRNGQLEVEVIQARGLTPKPGSKAIPAPYIKVYLIENGACLSKKKTRTAKKTWDPVYQQFFCLMKDLRGRYYRSLFGETMEEWTTNASWGWHRSYLKSLI